MCKRFCQAGLIFVGFALLLMLLPKPPEKQGGIQELDYAYRDVGGVVFLLPLPLAALWAFSKK